MNSENSQLPDTVEDLKEVIHSDKHFIEFQQNRIEHLEKQVRLLKSRLYV